MTTPVAILYYSKWQLLVSQARPNQPQCRLLSVSHTGKEESGDSRFLCVSQMLKVTENIR